MGAALQCFVTMQPIDGKADRGAETGWQSAPPFSIMNTQMPLVAAKQFVRSLANEGNFNILSRALRDEIHRDDGRCCNWFFKAFHDLWKRSFEFGLIKLHRYVPGAEKRSSLG